MRVGAVLRACRTRAGLSQEELANRLFISQSDVSKYENDTMEPHISTLQAWTNNTQAPEVLVAFICGMDGLSVMQSILEAGTAVINAIILGGIL